MITFPHFTPLFDLDLLNKALNRPLRKNKTAVTLGAICLKFPCCSWSYEVFCIFRLTVLSWSRYICLASQPWGERQKWKTVAQWEAGRRTIKSLKGLKGFLRTEDNARKAKTRNTLQTLNESDLMKRSKGDNAVIRFMSPTQFSNTRTRKWINAESLCPIKRSIKQIKTKMACVSKCNSALAQQKCPLSVKVFKMFWHRWASSNLPFCFVSRCLAVVLWHSWCWAAVPMACSSLSTLPSALQQP